MKLNRLIVEQNKIYSSKFVWVIQRYVDFMNYFACFQYAHCSTISSDTGGRPDILPCTDSFLLWNFCAISKSTLQIFPQMQARQSSSTIFEYTPTHKTFLYQRMASLYLKRKYKTLNIEFWVVSTHTAKFEIIWTRIDQVIKLQNVINFFLNDAVYSSLFAMIHCYLQADLRYLFKSNSAGFDMKMFLANCCH